MGYFFIIPMLLFFIIFYHLYRNKNGLPTNWPFVGMIPALLINLHRLNDFWTEGLEICNLTFSFNGPWFSDMNYVLTVDPSNVNHILSKKFKNYVKGKKLNEILESSLGNGILNTDDTLWLYHKNVALSFFNQPNKFQQFLVNITLKKFESGLIPILNHACMHENMIDMQELLLRFMYDTMCIIMMDHDIMSLSIDLPNCPLLSSIATLEHMVVYRHVVPTFVWKLLRFLNIGFERKAKVACKILDDLIYKRIDMKKNDRKKLKVDENHTNELHVDLLTFFMNQDDNRSSLISHHHDKFLRDSIVNFFLAGTETTSTALTWFFCLVFKNPRVLEKIKEELQQEKIQVENIIDNIAINFNDMNNKLIYFHATICETLRLYPSAVFNPKAAIEADILPSGHKVKKNTNILFNFYAMGRNKTIWGDDCNEFKPERWITQDGKIKHEPSYKFSVFGAGPRTCLGKQMALTQIKIIAIIVLQNYKIEAIENYHEPELSLVPRMKNGFKVKVFNRNSFA